MHVIPIDSVEYVEAQDDWLHPDPYEVEKSWMKTQSLSELERQLDPHKFVRVHRSYLLNIACMLSIDRSPNDRHIAMLKCGQRIPISRAGYERLQAVM